MSIGKRILNEKGCSESDILLGFHCPPFNSVKHLHLHVLAPASQMSFLRRMIFKPNTWWFSTVIAFILLLYCNIHLYLFITGGQHLTQTRTKQNVDKEKFYYLGPFMNVVVVL